MACGGDNQSKNNTVDWGDSNDYYLNGQKLSIKLPAKFKESSRYRINTDVPRLTSDKDLSQVVQSALESFEETDKNIDVFVDTTSQYHFVTILDAEGKITIDKSSAARLGKRLMEDYGQMNLSKRGMEVNRLESNIKKSTQQQLAKYKFEIINKKKKTKVYATSFFITNSTRSMIIHEFSDSKDDLELYTWSLKENF